jgi:hypothetical protein
MGTKRLCQSCGTKFYDLQRAPVSEAIAMAKQLGNTEHDTVALGYICTEFVATSPDPEDPKLDEACRYVRSWTRAFGLWEMAGFWEAVAMMELLKAGFPFGWKL